MLTLGRAAGAGHQAQRPDGRPVAKAAGVVPGAGLARCRMSGVGAGRPGAGRRCRRRRPAQAEGSGWPVTVQPPGKTSDRSSLAK
ncbi:MAG: hypothetical protein U1U88_001382 [Lawsonella clevelandensis]